MSTTSIPLLDVLARWAYSEIVNSNFAHDYNNGRDIETLRTKRRNCTPFEELTPEERYNLAFQCACVKPNLIVFTTGTDVFDIVEINRNALAKLFVPPNVWWPTSQGQFFYFDRFMGTTSEDAADCRNVVLKEQSYQLPTDPLTIGRSYGHPILLDGYHRAAAFWKFGPAEGKLCAYLPRALKRCLGEIRE